MTSLEILTRSTADEVDACVIWLHGLGADGNDFYDIVPMLGLSPELKIKFIFPHAPVQAVTVNAGMRMRAWYDIVGIGDQHEDDKPGITQTAKIINALIDGQVKSGIKSERIILAGFSQGGAISLFTGLRHKKSLGGILAMSAYLPVLDELESDASETNKKTPILMMHGSQDDVVPIEFAKRSKDKLTSLNYNLEWQTYPMAHSVCPEQCIDIGNWMLAQFT